MMKLLLLLLLSSLGFASPANQDALKRLHMSDGNQTHFAFAVMGDNRDGNNVLAKIIASLNNDPKIAFALNNGDLVPDGYQKEFDRYDHIIKGSTHPFLSVIGNHEIPWYGGEKNYQAVFGTNHFAFAYGNSYFIVFDSSSKIITPQQMHWIEQQLKIGQHYAHRFVFTHVPLYDPREGAYAKGHSLKHRKQAAALNDLFDRYHVTMLFASHIHFYYRGKWHQTPFIITGGAGAPLKHYRGHGFYHYVKVIVTGEDVTYKVVKIDAKAPSWVQEAIQSVRDVLDMP